jgi:hypothetical protein
MGFLCITQGFKQREVMNNSFSPKKKMGHESSELLAIVHPEDVADRRPGAPAYRAE